MQLPSSHALSKTSDSSLIRTLRGERVGPLPVWFMRQAGRSLPEYRELRKDNEMLDACLNPGLAAEITLQPVRRHNVDAGIFFSDIVVPLKLAGVEVEIKPGVGPVMENPVRSRADFQKLASQADFSAIAEAVKLTVAELGNKPLIAFGGAPFTLASYLIEGGPSRDFPNSRALMAEDPELWAEILNRCAELTAEFISTQVVSGASALQVFDSWAGRLTSEEYSKFAFPHSLHLRSLLNFEFEGKTVPTIHFAVSASDHLSKIAELGFHVIGVDGETSLESVAKIFPGFPLQGNIQTEMLTRPWTEIKAHIDEVLQSGEHAPSHVLNLGHGVPKDTDPQILTEIVSYVHEVSA